MLALTGGVAAAATARPAVSMVSLPTGVDFYSVEPQGDRLVLTGDAAEGLGCDWLVVSRGLRVESSLLHGSCERPPIAAEPVVPVRFSVPQGTEAALRIARPNATPSRVTYGPVVMTYEDLSDTRPQWVYSAGLLWLYDVATVHAGSRTTRAEVVEVSTATGRVVRTVPTAQIYRPLLAANADGLWIGADLESDVPAPAPTYHLAPGASTARLVHRGGYAAYWLVAAGHEVWEDIAPQPLAAHTEIWRFDGPTAITHALARTNNLVNGTPVVQSGSTALWLVGSLPYQRSASGCPGQQIVRIDARTGRQTVTRTLTLPGNPCLGLPVIPETFTGGSLYFIIPALTPGATLLYRIQP
jgi:hypothetical protein